jgi:hypothetical protein
MLRTNPLSDAVNMSARRWTFDARYLNLQSHLNPLK